jgi:hypothetical protein
VSLAALAVLAAPAQASNLVVKDLKFESTPSQSTARSVPSVVIDSDKRGRFGLAFTVKNTGKTRSHNVHPQIFISDTKFDAPLVGPIAPGHARTVRDSYNPRFGGPGIYDVYVCLSRNNCTKRIRFSAIPRRWNVNMFKTGPNSLTGIAPFFGADSTGMTFDFFGTVREGDQYTFLWLASGGVTGYTKGNDGFCTYKGTVPCRTHSGTSSRQRWATWRSPPSSTATTPGSWSRTTRSSRRRPVRGTPAPRGNRDPHAPDRPLERKRPLDGPGRQDAEGQLHDPDRGGPWNHRRRLVVQGRPSVDDSSDLADPSI